MVRFHPSENTLLEYSAGNLDWAKSICVAAHLEFCPECKNKVKEFNKIGAAYLTDSAPVEVTVDTYGKILDRIRECSERNAEVKFETAHYSESVAVNGTTGYAGDNRSNHSHPGAAEGDRHFVSADDTGMAGTRLGTGTQVSWEQNLTVKNLPRIVRKLIPSDGRLDWKKSSPSLRYARLVTGQNKYEVSFLRMKRGGKAVEHDHRGLEITLVLEGSFSDAEGTYMPGDYIVRRPGQRHRPMATQNQDCLCLSVVEAPVKVTGILGKLINPFLSVKPA